MSEEPNATLSDLKNLSDEELARAVETAVRAFLKSEGGAENAADIAVDQELWSQFDSLLIMELLVHLEERFGVQLNTGNLNADQLKTIAGIRDVATKAIRAAQA
jgi:acyl carrier protein